MDHIDYPKKEIWEKRQQWFEDISEPKFGGHILSEQACALVADLQSAFCVGAWVAVIILASAVIDAHLREAEGLPDQPLYKSIQDLELNPEVDQLRVLRNSFVHVRTDNPTLTVDIQWSERERLEKEARNAVQLVFEVMYANPWL